MYQRRMQWGHFPAGPDQISRTHPSHFGRRMEKVSVTAE
jgi:hypothetical protein